MRGYEAKVNIEDNIPGPCPPSFTPQWRVNTRLTDIQEVTETERDIEELFLSKYENLKLERLVDWKPM